MTGQIPSRPIVPSTSPKPFVAICIETVTALFCVLLLDFSNFKQSVLIVGVSHSTHTINKHNSFAVDTFADNKLYSGVEVFLCTNEYNLGGTTRSNDRLSTGHVHLAIFSSLLPYCKYREKEVPRALSYESTIW